MSCWVMAEAVHSNDKFCLIYTQGLLAEQYHHYFLLGEDMLLARSCNGA